MGQMLVVPREWGGELLTEIFLMVSILPAMQEARSYIKNGYGAWPLRKAERSETVGTASEGEAVLKTHLRLVIMNLK